MLPRKIKYNHKETYTKKRNNYKKYKNANWSWYDILNETHELYLINVHAITVIAEKYNINPKTLRNKYNKWLYNCQFINENENRGGHNKYFTIEQERDLYEYIKNVYIDTCIFFDDACLKIIVKEKWTLLHENDVLNISNGWIYYFKYKWKLSTRKSSYTRTATNINTKEINLFLTDCRNKSKNIDKNLIFNMDETFWRIINGNLNVIGITGTENRKLITGIDIKSGFTAIFMISASGLFHKPIIIIKGKTDKCLKKLGLNNDTEIYSKYSINGWISEDIMLFILKQIYNISNGNSAILILDKYSVHRIEKVKEEAVKLNIILIYVPVGCTSIHQPLDVCINGPIKSIGKKLAKNIYMNDPFIIPTLHDSIISLIESKNKIKKDTIIKSFSIACNI